MGFFSSLASIPDRTLFVVGLNLRVASGESREKRRKKWERRENGGGKEKEKGQKRDSVSNGITVL